MDRGRLAGGAVLVVFLAAACGSQATPPAPAGATASPASATAGSASVAPPATPARAPGLAGMTPALWAADLDAIDQFVRSTHVAPFTRTPEETWAAEVEKTRAGLPTQTQDETIVAFMRLFGLLDSHSGLSEWDAGYRTYPILAYAFSDGVYVLKAWDQSLIGARVDGIGTGSIDDVLASLHGLNGADNDSAVLGTTHRYLFLPEVLVANGFVADRTKAQVHLTMPDGTVRVVDPPDPKRQPVDIDALDGLEGAKPEAVARRRTPIWWTIDARSKTFYIAYNEAGTDASAALTALADARAAGTANRVVIDLRFDPGGRYHLSLESLLDPLAADPDLNRADRLAVLIGREGFSATGALASSFDVATRATLFGEPTPTRANPFLDPTMLNLPNSGLPIYVPTSRMEIVEDDAQESVIPDVPVAWSAVDFFAGRDPVLDAALAKR